MTGGWQSQAARMRRWHSRLRAAANEHDRHDFLYSFFENAFHLRDWLADTGAVEIAALDLFFDSHVEMRLCRDLANSHKHYSISRPSQPAPPCEAREYTPGMGNLADDVSLVVLSDGTKHDAFLLADRILGLWEAFIAAKMRD